MSTGINFFGTFKTVSFQLWKPVCAYESAAPFYLTVCFDLANDLLERTLENPIESKRTLENPAVCCGQEIVHQSELRRTDAK